MTEPNQDEVEPRGPELWAVDLTDCGEDDGVEVTATWDEAEAFRQSYLSAGVHQRTAVIYKATPGMRIGYHDKAPTTTAAPQPTGGEIEDPIREQLRGLLVGYANTWNSSGGGQTPRYADIIMEIIAAERTKSAIAELERKISVNIDQFSSADYKAGFQDALDQIDAIDAKRLASLRESGE